MDSKKWWNKDLFPNKIENLRKREKIFDIIRNYFKSKNFMEVDTPILQVSPGIDTHIHVFKTTMHDPLSNDSYEFYLHTSPEFAMKKLLATNTVEMSKIFQITKAFRNENITKKHLPEFTILEWYRTNSSYIDLMIDCEELIKKIAQKLNIKSVKWENYNCNLFGNWEKLSISDAFKQYAGFNILDAIDDDYNPDVNAIKPFAKKLNINVTENDTWQDVYYKIMLEKIEPNLGINTPTFLYDYPISEAALSKKSEKNKGVAERFELYISNVEIANAFTELTNPEEQLQRFKKELFNKEKIYGYTVPIDYEFIEALKDMPESSGIAMGIDRLVMLFCNAKDIKDISFVPFLNQID